MNLMAALAYLAIGSIIGFVVGCVVSVAAPQVCRLWEERQNSKQTHIKLQRMLDELHDKLIPKEKS